MNAFHRHTVGLNMNRFLNALTFGTLIAGALTGCDFSSKPGTTQPATTQADAPKEDEAPKVKLDPAAIVKFHIVAKKVYAHAMEPTFIAPARVAFNSEAMANVSAPVAGRIHEIKVKLGDTVKKGDELLIVVSNDLGDAQSDYLLKQTATDAATEAAEYAKGTYDRANALFEKSEGLSQAEVKKREADWKAAESAQKVAREAFLASIRKLRLLGMNEAMIEGLGKSRNVEPHYTVRAPIDGQIIERNGTLGQPVGPDKDPLFTLADTDSFWVIADVPESRIQDVAKDAVVHLTIGSAATEGVDWTVAYIAPAIDPATRTVQVRIVARKPTPGLKPGMFAQAEFDLPAAADAEPVVSVPEAAVQTIDGKPCVFVPDDEEPNTFGKRIVIVGRATKGKVPLLFGVAPREKVVISGANILKEELGKPAPD